MLTDDLYAHAGSRGSEAALVFGEERLSYADLLDRVERLAHGLTASGIVGNVGFAGAVFATSFTLST